MVLMMWSQFTVMIKLFLQKNMVHLPRTDGIYVKPSGSRAEDPEEVEMISH
jgi:hypothetical protein